MPCCWSSDKLYGSAILAIRSLATSFVLISEEYDDKATKGSPVLPVTNFPDRGALFFCTTSKRAFGEKTSTASPSLNSWTVLWFWRCKYKLVRSGRLGSGSIQSLRLRRPDQNQLSRGWKVKCYSAVARRLRRFPRVIIYKVASTISALALSKGHAN